MATKTVQIRVERADAEKLNALRDDFRFDSVAAVVGLLLRDFEVPLKNLLMMRADDRTA